MAKALYPCDNCGFKCTGEYCSPECRRAHEDLLDWQDNYHKCARCEEWIDLNSVLCDNCEDILTVNPYSPVDHLMEI